MNKKILFSVCFSFLGFFVFSQTSWSLTGNSSINPSLNFIGTTDAQPLVFKTNGTEKMRINADGSITQSTIANSSVNFSTENISGGWVSMNSNTTNPTSTGVGYRCSVNNVPKSQIFYNKGYFALGTAVDGLEGNVDILSRSGDVYLSTGTFLSNGLIVKNTTGYVGIGTPTPLSKLHIQENTARVNFTGAGIGTAIIRNQAGTSNYSILDFSGGSSNLNAQSRIASLQTASGSFLQFGTSNNYASGITNTAMTIDYAGNVGIGTTTPSTIPGTKLDVNGNIYTSGKILVGTSGLSTDGYSLAVNGSAIFTKATVKLNGSWPDYIFSPTYKMPSLDSLEQFIQQNKHLPEIPTASDVEKNGIDLGNNQVLLLKKIEELTLIVIEQNKRMVEQNKNIQDLKKVIQKIASNDHLNK